MELRYLGHAAFALSHDDTTVLIDPFLTGNPKAPVSADEVTATTILLTHGHRDHLGDTVAIAHRTGASVFAIVELANEIGEEAVQVHGANLGGTVEFDWGWVKLVPAWHTSTTPKGTVNTPAGLLIGFEGTIIYHLGDTCLFSDLRLVRESVDAIDFALICIGGNYTMDRREAVKAAALVDARTVIPCHYNTFPLIETDVEAFRTDVEEATESKVLVLQPGGTHSTVAAG
jgi:L-ascorbate metabolism protein UlaG (beta-lactamase superfamily)